MRPNRLSKRKDKKYHIDYCNHIIENIDTNFFFRLKEKYFVNTAFYKGDQWLFYEDLDSFLMDESGDVRNRIKFVQNIVRPIVEFYRGSITRMDMSAKAYSRSTLSQTRKLAALQKAKIVSKVAKEFPEMKEELQKKYFFGDNDDATENIINSLAKDRIVSNTSHIINYLSDINDIENLKTRLATTLPLAGICIAKEDEISGRQIFDEVNVNNFFFDTSAERPDLKDAEFMGEARMVSISSIVEMHPSLNKSTISALERSARIQSYRYGFHNDTFVDRDYYDAVPVYEVHWKDFDVDSFSGVIDELGFPRLVRTSEIGNRKLMTKEELKSFASENQWIEKTLKFNQNVEIVTCVPRFCIMIPSMYCEGIEEDIILDYGIREHTIKYESGERYIDWKYKVYTWSYVNGEILSPIDDLISPQRFINRMISMTESHINNTRGSGILYSEDIIDEEGGEEEILRSMNLGKPIRVSSSNLNNSVVPYGNQIGSGTFELFNLAKSMKQFAESVIGGGESLMGQGGAYRASATIYQQNLNQGTTMQEPVFFAVASVMIQVFKSMANRGRRILSANSSVLNIAVGDNDSKTIYLSSSDNFEEIGISIERSNNPIQERQAANEQLLFMLKNQLISQLIFAKYYDKCTVSEIGMILREDISLKIQAEREKAKAEQDSQQKQLQIAQATTMLSNAKEDYDMSVGEAKLSSELLDKSGLQKGLQ